MLQPLTSYADYERITRRAETELRELTLIGYLDEPVQNMSVGDLILFVGSTKKIQGIEKYLLNSIKTLLVCNSMNVKQNISQLLLYGEVIVKTTYVSSPTYSSATVLVKIVNGLNNYGIAGYEVYKHVLESVDKFMRLIGGKGDY